MFCSFLGRVLFASNFILSAYQDAGYSIVVVGNLLESYFISLGVLEKYKSLHSEKVQYLAIVIQNEEAYQISEVVKLLKWLDFIGVKNVCLYDMNGILKKFKETILQNLKNAKSIQVSDDDTDSIQTLTGLFLLIMEVSDDDTDSIQTVETLNDEILVSTADIHAWDIPTILTFLTIKVQGYSVLVRERFGPMAALMNLHQISTVEGYYNEFDTIINKLNLTETYKAHRTIYVFPQPPQWKL